jgi:hypothetical protein
VQWANHQDNVDTIELMPIAQSFAAFQVARDNGI